MPRNESMSERHDRLDREALEVKAVAVEVEPLKWYIQCRNCGEVFDDVQAAGNHEGISGEDGAECVEKYDAQGRPRITPLFSLVTEEEAF